MVFVIFVNFVIFVDFAIFVNFVIFNFVIFVEGSSEDPQGILEGVVIGKTPFYARTLFFSISLDSSSLSPPASRFSLSVPSPRSEAARAGNLGFCLIDRQ